MDRMKIMLVDDEERYLSTTSRLPKEEVMMSLQLQAALKPWINWKAVSYML